MPEKKKYYVVWKGRKTGIFTDWEACSAQVNGFTGARYKSFASRSAAENALHGNQAAPAGRLPRQLDWAAASQPPASQGLCVDAACSGNPGRLEYRGVELGSEKVLFHEGPFENGTNNIGEFLAIVQALTLLASKHKTGPVYSNSTVAIRWVKAKRCNTDLRADRKNAPLFERIENAESWLEGHPVTNPILKWDTRAWGEIPADFDRKSR